MTSWLDELEFDREGLIPVVIQDHRNEQVLMVGYMNREALEKTLRGPLVTFYSRSRQKLWTKGEDSGHTQEVKEVLLDCDSDALLIRVEQKVAACHEGYRSCFFRKVERDTVRIVEKPLFHPKEVYKK